MLTRVVLYETVYGIVFRGGQGGYGRVMGELGSVAAQP